MYPYFFRTIGENQQYEYVYLQLMQHLKWSRVAALTEDGQKYTEYISHMETYLKEHSIELISNKKFQRYVTSEEMHRVNILIFFFRVVEKVFIFIFTSYSI